jgi:S-ribosylhomocysteine lyase
MKRIESFDVDHTKLKRGIYVSRKDYDLDDSNKVVATTFDVRMKEPNKEEVIKMSAIHTLEHLIATYLRNNKEWKDKMIYWGPMGCRTGFYAIFQGDYQSADILEVMKAAFNFAKNFTGEIPGATAKECGNYLDHNLPMAKEEAAKYYDEVLTNIKEENLNYLK